MTLGHHYSFDIEKCAKELSGELDVPTNKCSKVIQTVAKWVFGKTINMTDFPSTSTVGNMLDRAQCLSKYQVAEGNGYSEMWDLHSDGTTRDGKKCVSTQVILDTGRSLSTPLQSRTSLATLMGVMCSTSQCELRSTFPNLRVTNVIRIVTFYTLPPSRQPRPG